MFHSFIVRSCFYSRVSWKVLIPQINHTEIAKYFNLLGLKSWYWNPQHDVWRSGLFHGRAYRIYCSDVMLLNSLCPWSGVQSYFLSSWHSVCFCSVFVSLSYAWNIYIYMFVLCVCVRFALKDFHFLLLRINQEKMNWVQIAVWHKSLRSNVSRRFSLVADMRAPMNTSSFHRGLGSHLFTPNKATRPRMMNTQVGQNKLHVVFSFCEFFLSPALIKATILVQTLRPASFFFFFFRFWTPKKHLHHKWKSDTWLWVNG